jgi:ABC-2 type transport system permease protein
VKAAAFTGGSTRRFLRLVWAGWAFNLKNLTLSGFFLFTSAIMPVIFATLAFFMWRAGGHGAGLLYVALGAGLMGIWSTTLFASGGAIQWQRWQGTLELSIAAPPDFVVVLLPMTLANASIGLYSLTATLVWGRVFFGVPLAIAHPVLFALAIPATILSLGLLGLVLASTFVLYRNANAMSNLLEWPVWLVSGLLVQLSLLPGWVQPISWVLAPTWGVKAIRGAALGGGDPLFAIGMCLALGAVYLVIGTLCLRNFERLARERATLSLT